MKNIQLQYSITKVQNYTILFIKKYAKIFLKIPMN
jgi:hypothetical protein